MQSVYPSNSSFAILHKSVQFCGRTIAKSKKKVRWVIQHDCKMHEVICSISFYSGRKRAEHNGFKIMDIVDPKSSLHFEVYVGGMRRVIFAVDEGSEMAKLEARQGENSFAKFENVFSGQRRGVYEQVFGG